MCFFTNAIFFLQGETLIKYYLTFIHTKYTYSTRVVNSHAYGVILLKRNKLCSFLREILGTTRTHAPYLTFSDTLTLTMMPKVL